jgi:hypothetical protein
LVYSMDTGAELTLQIVRLAHSHTVADVSRIPQRWTFWPHGERCDWEGARALLSRLAKPVLVAPLAEPGMLGLWTVDMLAENHRRAADRELTNQVQYLADKLAALNHPGSVKFGSGASAYQMTGAELLQWATEYALNLGISLGRSSEANVAHVLVRPSGGGAPPITV